MQLGGNWQNAPNTVGPREFTCGHSGCGREVGSEKGWFYHHPQSNPPLGWVYICPICDRPTFFDVKENKQIPGVSFGYSVEHLPQDINKLYEEIRKVTAVEAYTAAALACRKLLMHIAVEKSATAGSNFIEYVDYLVDNHYAPPGSKPWVDKIRQSGNEANHEIKIISKEEALDLINFVEMLLRFMYEFPGKLGLPTTP